jgi:hypothetical protein
MAPTCSVMSSWLVAVGPGTLRRSRTAQAVRDYLFTALRRKRLDRQHIVDGRLHRFAANSMRGLFYRRLTCQPLNTAPTERSG